MNFYDEAIESKHDYLRVLRSKREHYRDLRRKTSSLDDVDDNLRKVIANQSDDMRGLETAESYFWEPRITQLVLASGQQLPRELTFQPSWLSAPSGWWWFDRSSPLVGLSKENERKYVHALFYRVDGAQIHVATYQLTGTAFEELGSTVWKTSDPLSLAVSELKAACNFQDGTTRRQIDEALFAAIRELKGLEGEINSIERKRDWLSSRINDLETFLTDEGKAAFESLETDDERIAFLEQLREPEPDPEPGPNLDVLGDQKGHMQALLVDWRDMSVNALLTFVCGNLWLQQKIVVTDPGQLTRAASRRLARIGVTESPLIVRLRKKEYVRHKEGEVEPVDWAYQWAVHGHWRNQPTNDGIRLIWIHPYIKGPDNLPLKPGAERVFAVTR